MSESSSGAGSSTFNMLFDDGGSGFAVEIEDSAHGVLTSATLSCAGDCIDVQAVVQGGVPPYTYTWSDGTPGPTRHVCLNATATISVSVADAGVTGGEFPRPPWTTKATLAIQVLSCSDAGRSDPEPAPAGDASSTSDTSSSDGDSENTPGCASGRGADSGSRPSCMPGGPGMTNCGASSESCCTSLEVVGGTYSRTYPNTGSGPTAEADPATVSCFRLDKYEVTVGRFRQFVKAWNGGWLPPAGSGKHTHLNGGRGLANLGADAGLAYETGWVTSDDGNIAPTSANLMCATYSSTWTPLAGARENLPINCVNWPEAYAFCIWDGGFLPSEAEWEYAAAGGSQQRDYPWGTAAPGTGNQYAIYGCYYPSGSGSCMNLTTAAIAPVGTATAGAGVWGQLDLAGNVFEWTMDRFAAYVGPSMDAANLTAASYRVTRGGYFESATSDLVAPYRSFLAPSGGSNYEGFRCARTP